MIIADIDYTFILKMVTPRKRFCNFFYEADIDEIIGNFEAYLTFCNENFSVVNFK